MSRRAIAPGPRFRLLGGIGFSTAILTLALAGCDTIATLTTPIPACDDPVICSLLSPAPTLPVGSYDYFGSLKTPDEARALVTAAALDPALPESYLRIGLIEIT
ncbi:MAG TPA: hypothetical protein VMV81_03960, partial [Phycisphaerae bacterium]|nr:hypothetical protein [Phycisphaerae bacterium]